MLNDADPVGKADRRAELDLILRLVRPVPAPLFRLPEDRGRQASLSRQLRHIVLDAVFIKKFRLLKGPRLRLVPEAEGDAGVHYRLALHHIRKILRRNGRVGEHIQIRQPPGPGAGLPAVVLGQRGLPQLAHDLSPLKVQGIFKAVPPDGDVHIPGGILGGAGAQAV